ncbi:MAG: hypothetical protein AMJ79_09770 [Phycisphaerae bacterium SM23_30]|nr:MAG: hypothetical protein AMJ79_09770 [Phycisphaerae bacterium SM23_30]
MTNAAAFSAAGGAGGAGSAAAAAAHAIKASGAIVHVTPDNFFEIVHRMEQPLVVHSPSKFMTPHKYLTNYKGLFFYTKSKKELHISSKIELIDAEKIWIP